MIFDCSKQPFQFYFIAHICTSLQADELLLQFFVDVVDGGYGCRGCMRDCAGCDGFEATTRKHFKKDGYIVKVLPRRKSVGGTAWYQLNHASVKRNTTRFHVATWFGVCSYRKLKVTVEPKKRICPICSEELVKLHHLGIRRIIKDRDSPEFVGSFVDDLVDDDGALNWCEASSGSYG